MNPITDLTTWGYDVWLPLLAACCCWLAAWLKFAFRIVRRAEVREVDDGR